MKSLIKILLLSFITTLSYSQDKSKKINEKNFDNIDLTEVIINNTGKNLTHYICDLNVDSRVTKLQNAFLDQNLEKSLNGYDLEKNQEKFDTYQVLIELENGGGKLLATYSGKGKLISVVEKYENIQLPNYISSSVYKEYPGWQIIQDKYHYSQEVGKNTKKEYKITMTKDNKTKKITVIPQGSIVAIR